MTRAKTGGVTPGLQLRDRTGVSYIVKFDDIRYPELQSAAEVIATKILYAAGYNVPENYIAYVSEEAVSIGEGVEMTNPDTLETRPFTRDDLKAMLRRVARTPDGRYRALASKFLSGKPKGPFSPVGIRMDDPNDRIPHEHRRELRGMRVIGSWINHWDMKEHNSLDMYVEEDGRMFLRHYLIDFGSALGGGQRPTEYGRGREHVFDMKSIMKELFTLGIYVSADEKKGRVISPEVGVFSADDFDPEEWRPNYPVIAYANMTAEDAFWATRIILSFTEPELRAIVETGRYSNPKNAEYVLQTLLERRRIVAAHWLSKVNPLAEFAILPAGQDLALTFRDLVGKPAAYSYQMRGKRYASAKRSATEPRIILDRAALGAAFERGGADAPIEVTVWTERNGTPLRPVKVYFYWSPAGGVPSIHRISRTG